MPSLLSKNVEPRSGRPCFPTSASRRLLHHFPLIARLSFVVGASTMYVVINIPRVSAPAAESGQSFALDRKHLRPRCGAFANVEFLRAV